MESLPGKDFLNIHQLTSIHPYFLPCSYVQNPLTKCCNQSVRRASPRQPLPASHPTTTSSHPAATSSVELPLPPLTSVWLIPRDRPSHARQPCQLPSLAVSAALSCVGWCVASLPAACTPPPGVPFCHGRGGGSGATTGRAQRRMRTSGAGWAPYLAMAQSCWAWSALGGTGGGLSYSLCQRPYSVPSFSIALLTVLPAWRLGSRLWRLFLTPNHPHPWLCSLFACCGLLASACAFFFLFASPPPLASPSLLVRFTGGHHDGRLWLGHAQGVRVFWL